MSKGYYSCEDCGERFHDSNPLVAHRRECRFVIKGNDAPKPGTFGFAIKQRDIVIEQLRAELTELRKQLEAAESRLREIDAALPVAWLIDDGRNAPWFCESDFLAERYGGDAKPMIHRPARWSKQEGV